jgi:hypothetical protein
MLDADFHALEAEARELLVEVRAPLDSPPCVQ